MEESVGEQERGEKEYLDHELVLTKKSPRLGRGESVEEILNSRASVTEGVPTTKAVMEMAKKKGIEMPITQVIYRIVFDGLDPRSGVNALMTRTLRPE